VPLGRRTRLVVLAVAVLGPLAAWWLLSVSGLVKPALYLPTPPATLRAGLDMLSTGQLYSDAAASVGRVGVGFGLAVAVSVPLGIVMGSFATGWSLFEPVIGLLRYLPAAAFIPLLIIWLGLDEEPKIAVIFLGTFFFNTLMTADVVRGVPVALIDVSYTLGARTGDILRKVIIPHSLPGMIDAVRVNAAAAWSFVVVAELIAAQSGLVVPHQPVEPAHPGRPHLRGAGGDRRHRPRHRHRPAHPPRPHRTLDRMSTRGMLEVDGVSKDFRVAIARCGRWTRSG
jgi:NitT/TauT family transport system permease protein